MCVRVRSHLLRCFSLWVRSHLYLRGVRVVGRSALRTALVGAETETSGEPEAEGGGSV